MAEQGTPESPEDSQTPESISRDIAPITRRSLRAANTPTSRQAVSTGTGSAPRTPQTSSKKKRARNARSTVIMALAVPALFGTVALPAYAFAPADDASENSALQLLKQTGAQSYDVAEDVTANTVVRDGYSATTEGELAAARAAEEAAAQRATFATNVTSYTGPSASDYLENPPYPDFSLDQVFQVALQYQGVPYVYGGATPAGFDCSGFVKYVFAQFGIDMPHSSTAQGAMGTRISVEDAVPGDLVVSAGHIGFYAGNGMILHASRPGVPLRIGPIYASDWWVVRIGI